MEDVKRLQADIGWINGEHLQMLGIPSQEINCRRRLTIHAMFAERTGQMMFGVGTFLQTDGVEGR